MYTRAKTSVSNSLQGASEVPSQKLHDKIIRLSDSYISSQSPIAAWLAVSVMALAKLTGWRLHHKDSFDLEGSPGSGYTRRTCVSVLAAGSNP